MWRIILNITIVMLLTSSCAKHGEYTPPNVEREMALSAHVIASDLPLTYPYALAVSHQYMFVLALSEQHWVQVFDINDGNYIGGFVTQGEGPGEVSVSTSFQWDESESILSVFDQAKMLLNQYRITAEGDSLQFEYIESASFCNLSGVVRNAFILNDSTTLVDGQLESGVSGFQRYQLLRQNRVIDAYRDFPVAEDKQIAFVTATSSLAPSRQKMAVGTLYGAVLELIHIESDSFGTSRICKFFEPQFATSYGSIRPIEQTIFGFSAVFATEDCIYTVLIADKDPNTFNKIYLFDWEGNCKIRYDSDCLVYRLYKPDFAQQLYAIAYSMDDGFSLVRFSLPEKYSAEP